MSDCFVNCFIIEGFLSDIFQDPLLKSHLVEVCLSFEMLVNDFLMRDLFKFFFCFPTLKDLHNSLSTQSLFRVSSFSRF